MHGLLAPFLSDSFAVLILHKPGFRGCHGENIIEIGDKRDCWNKRKGGGNSSLLVHSGLWDVGRGKTKEQKMSKRKSWAHSSNSNRAGNSWPPFLLRVRYLKQCWVPAFPAFFFAQLLERVCAGSSPGLGMNQPGNCAACLCRALNRLALKVLWLPAQVLLVKILMENQAISWPLGRETWPFTNLKAKTAWVCPKLFNKEKTTENQRVKVFYSLSPLTTHLKTCCHLFRPQMKVLLPQSPSFELKCCWCSSSHDQLSNVLNIPGIAYMVVTLQLLFTCRITAWVRCSYCSSGTTTHCKPSSEKVSFTYDSFSHPPLISRYPFMLNRWQASLVTLLCTSLLCSKVHLHESICCPSLSGNEIFLMSSQNMVQLSVWCSNSTSQCQNCLVVSLYNCRIYLVAVTMINSALQDLVGIQTTWIVS